MNRYQPTAAVAVRLDIPCLLFKRDGASVEPVALGEAFEFFQGFKLGGLAVACEAVGGAVVDDQKLAVGRQVIEHGSGHSQLESILWIRGEAKCCE